MKAIHPSPILQALTVALRDPNAVQAFTCYDFDSALAVVDAAEGADFPVILNVAPTAQVCGLRRRVALRYRTCTIGFNRTYRQVRHPSWWWRMIRSSAELRSTALRYRRVRRLTGRVVRLPAELRCATGRGVMQVASAQSGRP